MVQIVEEDFSIAHDMEIPGHNEMEEIGTE